MSYNNTKNFTEHGGEETVIGGTLKINGTLVVDENATVTGLSADPLTPATDEALGGVIVGDGLSIDGNGVLSVENPLTAAENQADSEAEDVATLVDDFNALLAKLIAAGLMEEPAGD